LLLQIIKATTLKQGRERRSWGTRRGKEELGNSERSKVELSLQLSECQGAEEAPAPSALAWMDQVGEGGRDRVG
jgi:hypothetical protein